MTKRMKLAGIWTLIIGAFFGLGSIFTVLNGGIRFWDNASDKAAIVSVQHQVEVFEKTGSILDIQYNEDGHVRFTYHTCKAPNVHYNLYFLVNGVKKAEYKGLNPAAYGKFTTHCYTWSGQYLDLGDVRMGDEITVRYDFMDGGIADMIIIAK